MTAQTKLMVVVQNWNTRKRSRESSFGNCSLRLHIVWFPC